MKRVALLPIVLLSVLAACPAWGHEAVRLEGGSTIERDLQAGAVHPYTLNLDARQFIYGEADQQSVDVIVTVYSPDGRTVGTFDGSGRGPEPFQFTSDAAGTYRLEVVPFKEEKGRYSLTIKRAEPSAATPEGRVDQLMAAYKGDSTAGGVITVVRNGAIVFAEGYGMADLENGIPNTSRTVYPMASVSKQFTAFAIAMLAEQGILSFNDDIRKYMPELPDFGKTITLRHLLSHTSGLRDVEGLWAMSGGRPEDMERQEDLLRLVQRQRELNFHPGAQFLYCNSGYILLAEVVERATGEKFGDWMRENVFEPLGMTSTQVDDDLRLVNGRAYSYDFCDTSMSIKKIVFNSSAVGYTGLFTTAENLARWIRNFRTAEVGGPKVLKRMQKPIVVKKDSLRYALGLYIDDHRGLRRIWHSGDEGGYHTMLAFYPKLDAGVVVLSNFATWDATRTANAVAEAFFGDHMAREKTKNDRPRDAGLTIAAEVLQSYAGNYVIEGGATVMFTRESDGLSIQMGGQPCFPLVALADTLFRANLPGVKMRVSFHVEPDGRVARGTIWQARNTPMRRVEPWSPSPEERALYAGRYYSHELETFYTVAVEDDRLVACHPRHGNIALTPKNKDVFGGSEGFFSDVTFERDQAGVLTGMRVSGAAGRVRNVLFEKQK